MKSANLEELAIRLAELAEAARVRPPNGAALKVWADALEGCDELEVFSALTDWPKRNRGMPQAADIRRAVFDARAKRKGAALPAKLDLSEAELERAREIASQAEGADWMRAQAWARGVLANPNADRVKRKAAELVLEQGRPAVHYEIRNDGRDWARRILARIAAGEKLAPIAETTARGVLVGRFASPRGARA